MDKILAILQNWLKGISKGNSSESEVGKTIKALIRAVYWILAAVGLGQVWLWVKEGSSDDDDDRRDRRNEQNGRSGRFPHFGRNRPSRRN